MPIFIYFVTQKARFATHKLLHVTFLGLPSRNYHFCKPS
jgi:hypothetical protein